MKQTTLPAPFFIADDPAIDFLNSVFKPSDTLVDLISDGRGLLDWLEKAEMLPADFYHRLSTELSTKELDLAASKMRELRDWFRKFVIDNMGKPLNSHMSDELRLLNEILSQDKLYRQLELSDTSSENMGQAKSVVQWREQRHWKDADDLFLPVAQAMGKLICSANFEDIKRCDGPNCMLLFLDISKNRTRRWCSMAMCGNRAKAASYRAKKKAEKTPHK